MASEAGQPTHTPKPEDLEAFRDAYQHHMGKWEGQGLFHSPDGNPSMNLKIDYRILEMKGDDVALKIRFVDYATGEPFMQKDFLVPFDGSVYPDAALFLFAEGYGVSARRSIRGNAGTSHATNPNKETPGAEFFVIGESPQDRTSCVAVYGTQSRALESILLARESKDGTWPGPWTALEGLPPPASGSWADAGAPFALRRARRMLPDRSWADTTAAEGGAGSPFAGIGPGTTYLLDGSALAAPVQLEEGTPYEIRYARRVGRGRELRVVRAAWGADLYLSHIDCLEYDPIA